MVGRASRSRERLQQQQGITCTAASTSAPEVKLIANCKGKYTVRGRLSAENVPPLAVYKLLTNFHDLSCFSNIIRSVCTLPNHDINIFQRHAA